MLLNCPSMIESAERESSSRAGTNDVNWVPGCGNVVVVVVVGAVVVVVGAVVVVVVGAVVVVVGAVVVVVVAGGNVVVVVVVVVVVEDETVNVWVAVLMLPAGSETEATTVWSPMVSALGVVFHVPSPWTRVVKLWPATVTVTVEPGVAGVEPEMVGVLSVTETAAPPSIVMPGGTVSIVSDWEAVPTLPAASVTETATG